MKILACNICEGELEVIGNDKAIHKKIKCLKCGFTNIGTSDSKRIEPEIVIIRKRH